MTCCCAEAVHKHLDSSWNSFLHFRRPSQRRCKLSRLFCRAFMAPAAAYRTNKQGQLLEFSSSMQLAAARGSSRDRRHNQYSYKSPHQAVHQLLVMTVEAQSTGSYFRPTLPYPGPPVNMCMYSASVLANKSSAISVDMLTSTGSRNAALSVVGAACGAHSFAWHSLACVLRRQGF
eukprot:GHUV01035383.1.p1 GENE.GHUV01035383.1~~GHUV01035383.1.p1  ORF type:complete len:176 (+),score=19.53 GHUV01035383.1:814-1341(+)